MKIRTWCLACMLSFFSSFGHADFEKAVTLYESGDFEKAKIAFEILADIGDRSSLFNLGVMYFRGEAVEQNPAKAYVMMKIANETEDKAFSDIVNLVYSQLTESQLDSLQGLTLELGDKYGLDGIESRIFPKPLRDEDCFPPIRPIKQGKPVYPRYAQTRGMHGLVHVEMTISPEGYPRDLIVSGSSDMVFVKPTLDAAIKTIFPALPSGKPVYGHRYVYTYKMAGNPKIDRKTEISISSQLRALRESSLKGDPVAQYNYALDLNAFRLFKSFLGEMDLEYRTANKWLLESARKGLPNAQFDLGRNMLIGRGCEIDKENGYKWISAAAISGFSPAQNLMAQTVLNDFDEGFKRTEATITWLENAVLDNNFSSAVLLAWELSTSSYPEFRDGERALKLLEQDTGNYYDNLRIFETKAAANAAIGNFKKAVKFQKRAVKLAKKNEWQILAMNKRLELYESDEVFEGPYY